jgi:hypothetical protein
VINIFVEELDPGELGFSRPSLSSSSTARTLDLTVPAGLLAHADEAGH